MRAPARPAAASAGVEASPVCAAPSGAPRRPLIPPPSPVALEGVRTSSVPDIAAEIARLSDGVRTSSVPDIAAEIARLSDGDLAELGSGLSEAYGWLPETQLCRTILENRRPARILKTGSPRPSCCQTILENRRLAGILE